MHVHEHIHTHVGVRASTHLLQNIHWTPSPCTVFVGRFVRSKLPHDVQEREHHPKGPGTTTMLYGSKVCTSSVNPIREDSVLCKNFKIDNLCKISKIDNLCEFHG